MCACLVRTGHHIGVRDALATTVDIPSGLAADLRSLTVALGRPGTDLTELVEGLTLGLRTVVPSYLGMTMAVGVDGSRFTFTAAADRPDGDGRVATSVMVSLTGPSGLEPDTLLVLYASRPGAFVDLAADFSFSLGVSLDAVVLDEHLVMPTPGSDGSASLREISALNQAIGMLIDQGTTPENAHSELTRLAEREGVSTHTAAGRLIEQFRATPRDPT